MTLEEAIQTVSEGGQALGVTCEDVYKHMARDEEFVLDIFEQHHSRLIYEDFHLAFEDAAKHLLNEALRAKLEDEFGALE